MKQIIKLRILLLISLLCLLSLKANAQIQTLTYTVTTFVQSKFSIGNDDDNKNRDNDGYRAPSRPITIYISETEGLQIPQVNKDEIISYSIYNEDEVCVSTFTDETDFVNFVFSWTGTVQVRIEFEDYYLVGWMEL